MKQYIKQVLPLSLLRHVQRARNVVFDSYATKSYSQEGEDMLLRRIFEGRAKGFYVDVGAHHPRRFSNTYHFYKLGWSGINVDATPNSMKLFRRTRPRDINIEAAVSREPGQITFYLYNEPALNTSNKALLVDGENSPYRIIGERKVTARTLKELLSQHLPKGRRIDFLSVDAEGMDLEILQSNDWRRFRPVYVLAECSGGLSIDDVNNNGIVQFLKEQEYELFAKTFNTLIFREAISSASRYSKAEG